MKKNKKAKATQAQGRSGDVLFRLIIVMLAVILVIMAIATVVRVNRSFSDYVTTPNDLLRTIRNGYYADAVHEMYDNIALGETVDKDPDYAVPYALLEYYEAKSVYTAYERALEQESDKSRASELELKAEEFVRDMDTARSGMGELEFMAADIDELFDN